MSHEMIGDADKATVSSRSQSQQNEEGGKGQRRFSTITSFFRSLPAEEIGKSLEDAKPDPADEREASAQNADAGHCDSAALNSSKKPETKPKEVKWSLAWRKSKKIRNSDSDFEDVERTFPVDSVKVSKTKKAKRRKKKGSKLDKIRPVEERCTSDLDAEEPGPEGPAEGHSGGPSVGEPPAGESREEPGLPSKNSDTNSGLQELSPEGSSVSHLMPKSNVFDILMKRNSTVESLECDKPLSSSESSTVAMVTLDKDSCECKASFSSEPLNDSVLLLSDTESQDKTESNVDNAAETSDQPNMFDVLMKRHKMGGLAAESKTAMSSSVSDLETDVSCVSANLAKPLKKKACEFKLCIKIKSSESQQHTEDDETLDSSEKMDDSASERKSERKASKRGKRKKRLHGKEERGVSEDGDQTTERKARRGKEKKRLNWNEESCNVSDTGAVSEEGDKKSKRKAKKPSKERSQRDTEKSNDEWEVLNCTSQCVPAKKTKKIRAKRGEDANFEVIDNNKSPGSLDFESDVPRIRLRRKAEVAAEEEHRKQDLNTVKERQRKSQRKLKAKNSQGSDKLTEDGKEQLPKTNSSKDIVTILDEKSKDSTEFKIKGPKPTKTGHSTKKAMNDSQLASSEAVEPVKMASIFTKLKPCTAKTATGCTEKKSKKELVPASKSGKTSSAESPKKNNDTLVVKKLSQEEQEAANKAFNALFSGSHHMASQKTTAASVVSHPAPWPSVSHVQQKPADRDNLWDLGWPHMGRMRDLPTLVISELALGILNLNHTPDETTTKEKPKDSSSTDSFSDSLLKELVRELSPVYPGVPLRKLFKRYRARHEETRDSIQVLDNKTTKPTSIVENTSVNIAGSAENKAKCGGLNQNQKRGRPKRRLSSEGFEKQQKMARTEKNAPNSEKPAQAEEPYVTLGREQAGQKRERKDKELTKPVRRVSTRLQRQKETQDDAAPRISKRRRTDTEQTVATPVPDLDAKPDTKAMLTPLASQSEDSSSSFMESNTKKGQLWTDKYQPLLSTEVMANASSVSKLKGWLEKWKVKREKTLRKELELQKRMLAKQKRKGEDVRAKSSCVEWWDEDSDSDFQLSDESEDSEAEEDDGLTTAVFISGPKGVGKTAMVYACAKELGYKVFEVNCASKRSGKQIIKELEEATQSHLVFRNNPTAPSTTDKQQILKSPLASLFKQTNKTNETKEVSNKATKKRKAKKSDRDNPRKSILKETKVGSSATKEFDLTSAVSAKAASLILFEEVEVTFEEDKGFWSAVNSFMQNAKCPIIMISTESRVDCEGRYEHISLRPPSVNLLSAHLQLVCLLNNIFINPDDLKTLVSLVGCDIRKALLSLQFWAESGGGIKRKYEGFATGGQQPLISSSQSSTSQKDVADRSLPASVFGEESVFLSLSDWKQIKENPLSLTEPPVCQEFKSRLGGECSRDSIFDASETRDSQPGADGEVVQFPPVHHLLFESVQGLLNCVTDHSTGSLAVLRGDARGTSAEKKTILDQRFCVVEFCQSLEKNLLHSNLSELLPLFVRSAANVEQDDVEKQQDSEVECQKPSEQKVHLKRGTFLDKDLYDDGTEEETPVSDPAHSIQDSECPVSSSSSSDLMSTQGFLGFKEDRTRDSPGQKNSTVAGEGDNCEVKKKQEKAGKEVDEERPQLDGDSNSQACKPCAGPAEKLNTSALDIFSQFAEDMSYMDAFTPNVPTRLAECKSAVFGWWSAQLKPGLTDSHVTAREPSDWSVRDTRASIRGALELASLGVCNSKCRSLVEETKVLREKVGNRPEPEDGETMQNDTWNYLEELEPFLPHKDSNTVMRWTPDRRNPQHKPFAACRKLYSSVSSCLPVLLHCSHMTVTTDYLPTLRCICHSEKLREAANIKRRFLHYLDSNSFALSRTIQQSLADAFLTY